MRLVTKVHSLLPILLNTLVKYPIVRINSGFVTELLIFFTAEGFVLIVERLVDIVGFVALVKHLFLIVSQVLEYVYSCESDILFCLNHLFSIVRRRTNPSLLFVSMLRTVEFLRQSVTINRVKSLPHPLQVPFVPYFDSECFLLCSCLI